MGAPERFPDRCEHDEADLGSVQVVAYHRASGQAAGCYCLLLADLARLAAPFHVEQVGARLTPGAIPEDGKARLGYAELSGFCIIAPFRRFDAANEAPPWNLPADRWIAETRHRRSLAGLMWLTAAHLALTVRLDCLLTLMEPRLQQLGRTMGFDFQVISDPVDFRGLRVPYRLDRRSLRFLLLVPQTSALLKPILPNLEASMRRDPLLPSYFSDRTTKTHAVHRPVNRARTTCPGADRFGWGWGRLRNSRSACVTIACRSPAQPR